MSLDCTIVDIWAEKALKHSNIFIKSIIWLTSQFRTTIVLRFVGNVWNILDLSPITFKTNLAPLWFAEIIHLRHQYYLHFVRVRKNIPDTLRGHMLQIMFLCGTCHPLGYLWVLVGGKTVPKPRELIGYPYMQTQNWVLKVTWHGCYYTTLFTLQNTTCSTLA